MEDRPTQEEIGEQWGVMWGTKGVTQSAISQYFNGVVPINVAAAIRFSPIFGCAPKDILPSAPELRDFPKAEQISAKFLWPFGREYKLRYDELSQTGKSRVLGAVVSAISDAERDEGNGDDDNGGQMDELQRR